MRGLQEQQSFQCQNSGVLDFFFFNARARPAGTITRRKEEDEKHLLKKIREQAGVFLVVQGERIFLVRDHILPLKKVYGSIHVRLQGIQHVILHFTLKSGFSVSTLLQTVAQFFKAV